MLQSKGGLSRASVLVVVAWVVSLLMLAVWPARVDSVIKSPRAIEDSGDPDMPDYAGGNQEWLVQNDGPACAIGSAETGCAGDEGRPDTCPSNKGKRSGLMPQRTLVLARFVSSVATWLFGL
ncbi:MAG: hypothetical protein V2A71_05420 [Candidatus Eisenbacteria bacterium]